ncbi:hypothetical protein BDV06DRAFT_231070 [Aspergillus oleicola]
MTVSMDAPASFRHVNRDTPLDQAIRILKEDGVMMFNNLLDPQTACLIQHELDDHVNNWQPGPPENLDGYREMIGSKTKQVCNLSLVSRTFRRDLLDNPWIHSICREVLSTEFGGYWLNGASVLHVEPGEKAQVLHQDHRLYRVLEWRQPGGPEVMVNFIFALTEFTEKNGATRAVPGSHLWPETYPAVEEQAIPATMSPGDAMVFLGGTFHGAGANRSSAYRRGVVTSFHPTHFTPMESHYHLPRDMVEEMSPVAQKMLGWRSTQNHNQVPLWKAGNGKLEDAIGLNEAIA